MARLQTPGQPRVTGRGPEALGLDSQGHSPRLPSSPVGSTGHSTASLRSERPPVPCPRVLGRPETGTASLLPRRPLALPGELCSECPRRWRQEALGPARARP